MRKDTKLLTTYCNKCGKTFESEPTVDRCIHCGSVSIVKVKIYVSE